MTIKQNHILTRQDFDQAMVSLRLNISEVSRDTGVPRTYMSEFRNGDRQLRPENLAKLRDYFESKGLEFDNEPPEIPQPPAALPAQSSSNPPSSPYRFWPVYLEVEQPVAVKTLGEVQDNDARIAVLLQQAAERKDGLFSGGDDFTDDTKDALQEVFSLMSLNYALFRSLSGWPALGVSPSTESPETLRMVVFDTFREQLEKVGLVQAEVVTGEVA